MKKIGLLLALGMLFTSCSSVKMLYLSNDGTNSSEKTFYDIELASTSKDFFKVYKLENYGFAICPERQLETTLNFDDLERAVIITNEEAETFVNDLQAFMDKITSKDASGMFAEVTLKTEKQYTLAKTTSDLRKKTSESEETVIKDDTTHSKTITYNALKFQATVKTHPTKKSKINISYRNYSGLPPVRLSLNDVQNLINALNE